MGARQIIYLVALLTSGLCFTQAATAASNYIGYTGKSWSKDFGLLSGDCHTASFENSSPDVNPSDLAASVTVDPLFQKAFPESQTEAGQRIDAHCFGHTLELVPTGKAVHWKNNVTGSDIFLTPGKQSDNCRSFTAIKVAMGQQSKLSGVACSDQAGQWKIVR